MPPTNTASASSQSPQTALPVLLGCGILRDEVRLLAAQHGWSLEMDFLESSLHVDFEALASALQTGLKRNQGRQVVVFYGACHPHMEGMLKDAGTVRSQGQNCVEMLLGPERFMAELSAGAFFLLEDWARHWDFAISKTFGNNPKVVREIFQLSSKYLLCLRTPCSADFSAEAEQVSTKVGLPIRWLDVSLDHLDAVLCQLLEALPNTARSTGQGPG